MAHFVKLNENNEVIEGIVVHNNELLVDGVESEAKGIEFCVAHYGGRWVQTSYNESFRGNYATPGCVYDEERDAFIRPKPHSTWILNETTFKWEPPVPMPLDEFHYNWNDLTVSWEKE